MMKISFLVTYYNQAEYVRQSMDSILAIQKPEDWEILVGDDGSTDSTVQIVNQYIRNDPEHIRLFIMPRDQGRKYNPVLRASRNRLNLLENCTGDCFCTLDGDDFYFDTQFVMEAVRVFRNHPDVSAAGFGFSYFREGKREEDRMLPFEGECIIGTEDYLKNFYLHSGACVHRIIWDQKRIDEIQRVGSFDDNDIMINSLNYGKMYYINRAVYAYRQTGGSVFNSMDRMERILLNVQGYDIEKKLLKEDYHEALMHRYAEPLLKMFFLRDRIRKELTEDKLFRYEQASSSDKDSVLYKLLNYGDVTQAEKRSVVKLISHIVRVRPKTAARVLARQITGKLP